MFFCKVTVSVPFITSEIAAKIIVGVLVLWSWVYRTGLFLLVCILFRLTCELQILRFEGFRKLLEGRTSDISLIFQEHARIRTQLSATSHRYRCFIIGCLVTITVSQFGALLLVLESKETKTFFNSGDLIVSLALAHRSFCHKTLVACLSADSIMSRYPLHYTLGCAGAGMLCGSGQWLLLVPSGGCQDHTPGSGDSGNRDSVAHDCIQCIQHVESRERTEWDLQLQ